jgi:hypothetical protein
MGLILNASGGGAGGAGTGNTINLSGYWPFDSPDISGTTAFDRSGNARNGTISGATTSDGKINGALSFNGTIDYINLGSVAAFNSSAISVSTWIKADDVTNFSTVFGIKNSANTVWRDYIDIRNGKIEVQWGVDAANYRIYSSTNAVLTTGAWYHVVATIAGNAGPRIYVNGNLVPSAISKAAGLPYLATTQVASIGRSGAYNGQYFKGIIDEVRIYGRVLSAAEVLSLYQENLKINTQPTALTQCAGTTATFSVDITNTAPVVYSWRKNGTPLEGTNSATLTINDIDAADAGDYDVEITDANYYKVTSDAATLKVNPLLPVSVSIVAKPGTMVNLGTSVTYSATPVNGGDTPSYQWMKGDAPIPEATDETYTYIPDNGDMISVVLTSNAACATGNPARSNVITMTVCNISVAIDAIQNDNYGNEPVVFPDYQPLSSLTLMSSVIDDGSQPHTYLWSTGETTSGITVSPTVSTTYTLTVTQANGCVAGAAITVNVADVRCGNKMDKVIVCHNAGDNKTVEICVSPNAVPAHLAHGDKLGYCDSNVLKSATIPESFMNIYPNPSTRDASLEFMVDEDVYTTIDLFDLAGNHLMSVFNEKACARVTYQVIVPRQKAGAYLVKMKKGNASEIKKLVFQ